MFLSAEPRLESHRRRLFATRAAGEPWHHGTSCSVTPADVGIVE